MTDTVTRTPQSLRFGQPHTIPAEATAAWGARMIVKGAYPVDMVHDRQDMAGTPEDRQHLAGVLNSGLLRQVKALIDELRFDYWRDPDDRASIPRRLMHNDVTEDFVLHDADGVTVVANTNGSYGYVYVTAFYVPTVG